MKQLAKGLELEMNIRALTNDNGELRDEELVRLYRAGFPKCKTLLLERYDMILRSLAPRIVSAKGICPESTDVNEFAKDVAQLTCCLPTTRPQSQPLSVRRGEIRLA